MDGELERRWRVGAPPFDGQTVSSDTKDLTPLTPLRQALLAIVSVLQERWPDAGLSTLDDWHDHDGYVSGGKPTSWANLTAALASDALALALSRRDYLVRMAFFPPTYAFYLRIYVPDASDNDYPERRGNFDVTCAPELAAELEECAASASGLAMTLQDAKSFFDLRYSG